MIMSPSRSFDGKALPPKWEPPVYKGPEPTAEVVNGKICPYKPS